MKFIGNKKSEKKLKKKILLLALFFWVVDTNQYVYLCVFDVEMKSGDLNLPFIIIYE